MVKNNIYIRSWSGNRIYEDEGELDPLVDIFSASDFDFHSHGEKINNSINDDNSSESHISYSSYQSASSSSVCYDDDFDYSSHDDRSDDLQSNYDSDSSHNDIEFEVINSDDRSRYALNHETCVSNNTLQKKNIPNLKYKRWLQQLQNEAKSKEKRQNDARMELEMKRRKMKSALARKARKRSHISYISETAAAVRGKYDHTSRDEIEKGSLSKVSEDTTELLEKANKEQRRKHIHRYKLYMQQKLAKRLIDSKAKEDYMKLMLRRRKRLAEKVLMEMKEIKDGKSDEPVREGEGEHLKEKCIAALAEISRSRQERAQIEEKMRKRLDKRAYILKEKYNAELTMKDLRSSNKEEDESSNVKPNSDKLILSSSEVHDLALRLSKTKTDDVVILDDFEKWKRKKGINANQKVFCMSGWYPSIRDELISRGWYLNPDKTSTFFDLKFTLSSSDINFNKLDSNQLVNHFRGSSCLTTKAGLMNTLKNVPFLSIHHQDANDFFPRSYDLSDDASLIDFLGDFYFVKVSSILKKLTLLNGGDWYSSKINKGVLKSLLAFLRKKYQPIRNDAYLDGSGLQNDSTIKHIQSRIIQCADDWLFRVVRESDLEDGTCYWDPTTLCASANDKGNKSTEVENEKQKKKQLIARNILALSEFSVLSESEKIDIRDILRQVNDDKHNSQKVINGELSNNIWIVKPAGKSRGRGIVVCNTLPKIFQTVRVTDSNKLSRQFVVQKYIENPLTIADRKFDIRQWVMVTDWNPVTVWFYDDCYIRFAVSKYNDPQESIQAPQVRTDVLDDWKNDQYIHLVNNSIGKTSSHYNDSFFVEEVGKSVLDHMWSLNDFKEWLFHKTGEDIWSKKLEANIKNIVIDSILCAQEDIIQRKKSWEVYGFDIMIDNNYQPWLIEINSSPACDYSTSITENFVKRALPDIFKVILDGSTKIGSNENAPRSKMKDELETCGQNEKTDGGETIKLPETTRGGWVKIYQGNFIPKVISRFDADMTLKGQKIAIVKENNRVKLNKSMMATTKVMQKWKSSKSGSVTMVKPFSDDDLEFDDSDLSCNSSIDDDDGNSSRDSSSSESGMAYLETGSSPSIINQERKYNLAASSTLKNKRNNNLINESQQSPKSRNKENNSRCDDHNDSKTIQQQQGNHIDNNLLTSSRMTKRKEPRLRKEALELKTITLCM